MKQQDSFLSFPQEIFFPCKSDTMSWYSKGWQTRVSLSVSPFSLTVCLSLCPSGTMNRTGDRTRRRSRSALSEACSDRLAIQRKIRFRPASFPAVKNLPLFISLSLYTRREEWIRDYSWSYGCLELQAGSLCLWFLSGLCLASGDRTRETMAEGGGQSFGSRCFVSASASSDLTVPVRVGYYDLGKTIGKGNFAVVKVARHTITHSKVCIVHSFACDWHALVLGFIQHTSYFPMQTADCISFLLTITFMTHSSHRLPSKSSIRLAWIKKTSRKYGGRLRSWRK